MAVTMFTDASSKNRDTRPGSKSFMRGCVMPQWAAASSLVHWLSFMVADICCTDSARSGGLASSNLI